MLHVELKDVLHIVDLVMSDEGIKHKGKAIRKRLKELPTEDVEKVVRCNNCIFGRVDTEGFGYVKCLSRDTPWHRYKEEFSMPPYHFCGYGEKKEGEE